MQLDSRSRLPRATASLKDSTGHKMSDEELIKLSLSAAPEAVAIDATVVAMDHDGKMRTCAKEPAVGNDAKCYARSGRTPTRCAAIKTQWNEDGWDERQGAAGE